MLAPRTDPSAEPPNRTPSSFPRIALRIGLLLSLVVGVFGCDHATKMAAKANLEGGQTVNVVELRYTVNDDVAFSLLERLKLPHSPLLLASIAGIAIVIAGALLFRSGITKGSRIGQAGLAIALAGGLGNIVDRLLRGGVIDFIHVKGWPIFNVADIAVVVGMLLVAFARNTRPKPKPASRESMS